MAFGKTPRQQFLDQFTSVTGSFLRFDPKWKNGTGYLNGLQNAKGLVEEGKFAKCIDDHGRKVLIVGTAVGNVVIFERFTSTEEQPCNVFVLNCPSVIKCLLGLSGNLGPEELDRLIGSSPAMSTFENIGQHIKRLRNEAAQYEAEDEEAHVVG